eukprot:2158295-Rhodomonas_salina.1
MAASQRVLRREDWATTLALHFTSRPAHHVCFHTHQARFSHCTRTRAGTPPATNSDHNCGCAGEFDAVQERKGGGVV